MKSSSPIFMSRRDAMRAAVSATAAASMASPLQSLAAEIEASEALPYVDRLGLQLYTVRDQMEEDPEATLKAIAAAGYKQVELMSIDEQAVTLAAIARDQGMMVHSAFLNWRCITMPGADDTPSVDEVVDLAERIGLRHVVFGYIDRTSRDSSEKCKAIAERANLAAEKTKAAGMRMAYHNHSFEFGNFPGSQTNAFEIFVDRFDPALMDFEFDVFWARLGGLDPIATMKQLGGRISMVHLKDIKQGVGVIHDEGQVPKDAFQECGDGTIDMPEIMRLAKEIGVKECHVEQDQSPDPLQSIRQSIQYLRKS